jgi:hypothetical protein
MKTAQEEIQIPLQVGGEVRIRNTGEIIVDNPELELTEYTQAADAVLSYRFDRRASTFCVCWNRWPTMNTSAYIAEAIDLAP